jgi:hypothetical protein
MRLDPAFSAMRHKLGHRRSMAADDDGLAVLFQFGQQAGKVGLRVVNIHRFHAGQASPLSQCCQRTTESMPKPGAWRLKSVPQSPKWDACRSYRVWYNSNHEYDHCHFGSGRGRHIASAAAGRVAPIQVKSHGPTKEDALAALRKLRELGTFKKINDPVAWQREIRQDRPLLGRD